MKNLTGFAPRQLIARGAFLLCILGGLGAEHAQTPGPAPVPTQPDTGNSGGMSHGMGGMIGGMSHGMGGMSHGGGMQH
jgi:hypothetical protein